MAATIQAAVVVNASVGSGFAKVGSTLLELGTMVDQVGSHLREFGADSVKVYREYEKSMADAKVALSTTYGRGTKELNNVMDQLDVAATNWAASTIFHTNDVANAISEAAHAGWDFEQIMSGIPASMELAQAGSIDLSEAVNYLVKISNAAGIEFQDMGHFIDLWTFAANSSASTVDEFGSAMLRMGSTMRFAANPEELLTLIAVTANAGAVGSEAGTLIRNSMMRLIAPTDKAEKAMAQLGATSVETAGLLEDEALAAANARLAETGFSAFDQQGNLRNVLDIYRDLYVALGDVAGGFDNIGRNQDAMEILSAIFPTRTITEALNLLNAASEGYEGLYEAMREGDAENYGEYAAATMMDTLNGSIETFESKVERLKQLVGEELSGKIKGATEFAGQLVDKVAELPEGQFSALVSGLTTIAEAGPALLIAGGAFKLIGSVLTPAGGIGLGLVALTAAATAIKELQEADFASNFGDMEMDAKGLQEYVQNLGANFKEAYAQVDSFRTSMEGSVEAYKAASAEFSSELLTKAITGMTLTDDDKAMLTGLGEQMFVSVEKAITDSMSASKSFWQALYNGENIDQSEDPVLQEISKLTNKAYTEAIEQANQIGAGMRKALTQAFKDGTIDSGEYSNILSYIKSYNEAIAKATAEAQKEENYISMQKMLHKAQTASWDQIQETARMVTSERDKVAASFEDQYLNEYYRLKYEGASNEALAAVEAKYNQEKAELEANYDQSLLALWETNIGQSDQEGNLDALSKLAELYLNGSITGNEANAHLRKTMGNSVFAGDTGWGGTDSDRYDLGRMLGTAVASFGGVEGIAKKIAYYESAGNTAMADSLRQLYTMEQLVNNFDVGQVLEKTGLYDLLGLTGQYSSSNQEEYVEKQQNKTKFDEQVGIGEADYDIYTARRALSWYSANGSVIGDFFKEFNNVIGEVKAGNENVDLSNLHSVLDKAAGDSGLKNIYDRLTETYNFEDVLKDYQGKSLFAESGNALKDYFAMWALLFDMGSKDAEKYKIKQPEPEQQPAAEISEPSVDAVTGAQERGAITQPVVQEVQQVVTEEVDTELPPATQPVVQEVQQEEPPEPEPVQTAIEVDTGPAEAAIAALDNTQLTALIDGDTSAAAAAISALGGQSVSVSVNADTSAAAAAIQALSGATVTVGVSGGFAEGGRATQASIFGEAGPEWAIPEEHSERTAELLDAARAASGFTWPEILSRFGGFNASPRHIPATIVYSPTINAQDARGVAEALEEDKKRLEKWLEEKRMLDEAVVYA